MKKYLVGGAVRDQLLKRTIKERDWVVVGETPASMLALGFLQVGKDFPVFLHPDTKEEYALARKERKIAKGYKGFTFDASAAVSLEEDLSRRDLTINAIAQNEAGDLTDPYGGVDDIKAQLLRHVSPAFVEDPVRVLRLARFAARFPTFTIAQETQALMQGMVRQGEIDALVPERVWKEFESALAESAPWRFLDVLHGCGALAKLFPGIEQTYLLVRELLSKVSIYTEDAGERFVVMLQAIKTVDEIEKLCESYRIPRPLAWMASLVKRDRKRYLSIVEATSEEVLNTFSVLDAFRREPRFHVWLRMCQLTSVVLDEEANDTFEAYSHCYRESLCELQSLVIDQEVIKDLRGPEVGSYISTKRLERLDQVLPIIKKHVH